jgi:hypothetical protein
MSIEHGGNVMNRLVLVAARILAGVVAAQADMSRYTNMLK